MKNEDAIKYLKALQSAYGNIGIEDDVAEFTEALSLAIDALSCAHDSLRYKPSLMDDGTLVVNTELYPLVRRVSLQCGNNKTMFYEVVVKRMNWR